MENNLTPRLVEKVDYGARDQNGNRYYPLVMDGGFFAVKLFERALDDVKVDRVIFRSFPHVGKGAQFRCRFSAYKGQQCVSELVTRRLCGLELLESQ